MKKQNYLARGLIAVWVCLMFTQTAVGSEAYPYWPEYEKTALVDIRPQQWRTTDDIIIGWDWSLPPEVKPAKNGLLAIKRSFDMSQSLHEYVKPLDLPINPTITLWVKWRDLEAQEGQIDFSSVKQRMHEAEELGYSVVLRVHSSATAFAPRWMADKGVPIRTEHKKSKMVNYEISHPEFHKRYLQLVDALGESGIPQVQVLKGAYVGYASPSNGDEGIGPHGKDPDTFPHVIERLDAWARAFKGNEEKVFMGGISQHGLDLGFGFRRGFVEMYLYHIPDTFIGQKVDQDGYLWLDESAEAFRHNPFHGEENEEYEERWATAERGFRFGPSTDGFPYRYFTSNLRLLQMRSNYVLYNSFSLMPEQLVWVGQSLGRTVEDAPDIWCALRESRLRKIGPVKNFERWLYQRDSEGNETEPAVKIDHPIDMWMVERGSHYDFVARKGKRIGFAVDDRWSGGKPIDVAIKVSYFDVGSGSIRVGFGTTKGLEKRTIQCQDTKQLKTATFFVKDAVFSAVGMDYDIGLEGVGADAIVSFVRIVRL
jgi:hypothetical protein